MLVTDVRHELEGDLFSMSPEARWRTEDIPIVGPDMLVVPDGRHSGQHAVCLVHPDPHLCHGAVTFWSVSIPFTHRTCCLTDVRSSSHRRRSVLGTRRGSGTIRFCTSIIIQLPVQTSSVNIPSRADQYCLIWRISAVVGRQTRRKAWLSESQMTARKDTSFVEWREVHFYTNLGDLRSEYRGEGDRLIQEAISVHHPYCLYQGGESR